MLRSDINRRAKEREKHLAIQNQISLHRKEINSKRYIDGLLLFYFGDTLIQRVRGRILMFRYRKVI